MSEKAETKGRKGNGHKGQERRKGTGTLEKRGGFYIARWTVDGKRYSQSTGTADKREAEKKLAEYVAPFQLKDKAERLAAFAGKLSGVQARIKDFEESKPALKIADAWDAFVKSPNRKDTAGAERLRICAAWYKRFVNFMSKRYADITEIRGIGKAQAQAFATDGFTDCFAKDGFGACCNATRNQALSFFRMMWRVMIADESARIVSNPWDGIQKKHETHTRRREMTVEELARVYSLLKGEMRLLFSVGIYTGQRLGDCALLDWGQVDLFRRRITLIPRKTARKTGRMVIIPIHENLLKMLTEIPQAERVGYVMPECADCYLKSATGMSYRFKRVFKAAGIKTDADGDGQRKRALVSFHSLRHTFVSLAANAGVPLAVVQSIVGHSTVEMTRHYFHESENALVSAVAALPSVTGGESDAGGITARVRAIIAQADELTDAERGALLRHLQGKAETVAGVPQIENGDAQADAPEAGDVPTVEHATAHTVAA